MPGAITHSEVGVREFQILGAAMAANEEKTERRADIGLVSKNE